MKGFETLPTPYPCIYHPVPLPTPTILSFNRLPLKIKNHFEFLQKKMSQIIPEFNPSVPPPALPLKPENLISKTLFPDQLLWKLVKGKTVLQYHLCYGYLLFILLILIFEF